MKLQSFDVEETILLTSDPDVIESKIRSRGIADSHSYNHELRYYQNEQRITRKRQITAREYVALLDSKDESKQTIVKKRSTFIYESQCFIVDVFVNIEGSPIIMRCDTELEAHQMIIPPFVKILRDVTNEKDYQTGYMA